MKRRRSPAPDELLALYAERDVRSKANHAARRGGDRPAAIDGLDDDQRAAVERYLNDHPEAQQQVVELRETIAEIRRLSPRHASPELAGQHPSQQARPARVAQPDWDRMASAISQACDQAGEVEATGPFATLRRWLTEWRESLLRPRHAAGLAIAAAAALLLIVALRGAEPDGGQPDPLAETLPRVSPEAFPELEANPEGVAFETQLWGNSESSADLGTLDASELDVLLQRFGSTDLAELGKNPDAQSDDRTEEGARTPELPPELLAEWIADDSTDELADEPSGDPGQLDGDQLDEPHYEILLGELSERQLDALNDSFDQGQPG